MNSAEDKKTVHEEAIIEILDATKKLTPNKTLAINIFRSAGIIIDDRLSLVALTGNAETCLNSLIDKLSPLPVIKISVRRILRRKGLTRVTSVYFLCTSERQRETSWLTRRTG